MNNKNKLEITYLNIVNLKNYIWKFVYINLSLKWINKRISSCNCNFLLKKSDFIILTNTNKLTIQCNYYLCHTNLLTDCVNTYSLLYIPKFNILISWSWTKDPLLIKNHTNYDFPMSFKCFHPLTRFYLPHIDPLIRATGKQMQLVFRENHALNQRNMSFQCLDTLLGNPIVNLNFFIANYSYIFFTDCNDSPSNTQIIIFYYLY